MTPRDLRSRLASRRAQARRVLWFERVWPALWPVFALIGVWLAASLFDLPGLLPVWWHLGLLAIVVVALVGLTWRGLRPLRRPTDAEVDRRLERASGLRHRPLVVIDDQPAMDDPATAALWHAHRTRATAQIARLRAGWPRPGIPQKDMIAGRAILVALLVVGVVVAGPEIPGRLLRSVWPGLPQGAATPSSQLQAWLTPPSYTGLPPVFLHPDTAAIAIPAGSHLTVSLTGGSGEPGMTFGTEATPFVNLDAESWQAERDIAQAGVLTVRRRGRDLGQWDLTAIPDAPPVVAWAEPPGAGTGTRRLQTRLPWTASDDYGVVSLTAELTLKGAAVCGAAGVADSTLRRLGQAVTWRADAGFDRQSLGRPAGGGDAGGQGRAWPSCHQRTGRVCAAGASVQESAGSGRDRHPQAPEPGAAGS